MKMTVNSASLPNNNGSTTRQMRRPARTSHRRRSGAGPLAYKDALSLHAYVGADPINFIDPSGLDRVCFRRDNEDGYVTTDADGVGVIVSDTFSEVCGEAGDGFAPGPGGGGGGAKPNPPQPSGSEEEIVVTARKVAKKAAQCAADQFGITSLLGLGAIGAGQPIPGSKPFVNKGSSLGTSLSGIAADKVFGKARFSRRMPTLVGGTPGSRLRVAGTMSVARFAGRAVPVVGWGLLAYDVASIGFCVASGD